MPMTAIFTHTVSLVRPRVPEQCILRIVPVPAKDVRLRGRIAPWPSWTNAAENAVRRPRPAPRQLLRPEDLATQTSYDPANGGCLLELRLVDNGLSSDDRFCSLVEYFVRAQRNLVRQSTGDALQFRLYGADGSDLTAQLQARGARYLDDSGHGAQMRRRLAWLGFRHHFWRHLLPGVALWTVTIALLVSVLHLTMVITVLLGLLAMLIQGFALYLESRRGS